MVFASVPFTAFAEETGWEVLVVGEELGRKCSYTLSCDEGVKVATGSQVSLTIEENPGWVLAATPSMRKEANGPDVAEVKVSLDEGFYFYVQDWGGPTYIHLDLEPEFPDAQYEAAVEKDDKNDPSAIGEHEGQYYYEGELVHVAYKEPAPDKQVEIRITGKESFQRYDKYKFEDPDWCTSPYTEGFWFAMPGEDVEVIVKYVDKVYENHSIEAVYDDYYGVVDLDQKEAKYGEEVTFRAHKKDELYSMESPVILPSGETTVTLVKDDIYSFTMPDYPVKVYVEFSKSEDVHRVLDMSTVGGHIEFDEKLHRGDDGLVIAAENDDVYFNIVPDPGYHVSASGPVVTNSNNVEKGNLEEAEPVTGFQYKFKMFKAQARVWVTFEHNEYSVATASEYNGYSEADRKFADEGEEVTITAHPDEGYVAEAVEFNVPGVEATKVDDTTFTFKMPASDVEFSTIFKQYIQHEITAAWHTLKGDIAITIDEAVVTDFTEVKALPGQEITVTANARQGFVYAPAALSVKAGAEDVVLHQTAGSNTFWFTMPEADVTIGGEIFAATDAKYEVINGWNATDVTLTLYDENGVEIADKKAAPFKQVKAVLVPKYGYELSNVVAMRQVPESDPAEWVPLAQDVTKAEKVYDLDNHVWTWTYEFKMPNSDVKFVGSCSQSEWAVAMGTITTDAAYDSEDTLALSTSTTSNPGYARCGDNVEVDVTCDSLDGYTLSVESPMVDEDPVEIVQLTGNKWRFVMPDYAVTVSAVFTGKKFNINAATPDEDGNRSVENGYYVLEDTGKNTLTDGTPAVYASYKTHEEDLVYIKVYPYFTTDYESKEVKVTYADGSVVYPEQVSDVTYQFAMPTSDVTIDVAFQVTIAKICADTLPLLDLPKQTLNEKSVAVDAKLGEVGTAKASAHTDAKKNDLSAAETILNSAKENAAGELKKIADLRALIDTVKVGTDRQAALDCRAAAEAIVAEYDNAYAKVCDNAIAAADAALAIVERSVTFESNGGSAVPTQWVIDNTKVARPADPTRAGYTFRTWFADNTLKKRFDFETKIDRDLTVYADWTANSSSGGSGGGGGGGSSKGSAVPTYSSKWEIDAAGTWRIKDKAGNYVVNAWLCDNAVLGNGLNVWYLLNADGSMITAPLVQDNTGNYYSLEMNHNGYYGMLRYKNGVYDGIYMEFSQKHDGTFGAITNQSAIDALKAKYGVVRYGIDNSNSVYTKDFN